MQCDVPGVIEPWRQRQTDLADDLRPQLECGAGVLPCRVGQFRPRSCVRRRHRLALQLAPAERNNCTIEDFLTGRWQAPPTQSALSERTRTVLALPCEDWMRSVSAFWYDIAWRRTRHFTRAPPPIFRHDAFRSNGRLRFLRQPSGGRRLAYPVT